MIVPSATLFAAPAFANWFDNTAQGENHKKLLGGTPSPTPDNLRAIGDSKYGEGKSYYFDRRNGHWHEHHPTSAAIPAQAGAAGPASPVVDDAAKLAPAPPAKP